MVAGIRNTKLITQPEFLAFVGVGGIVAAPNKSKRLPPLPIDVPALPGILLLPIHHTTSNLTRPYFLFSDGFRPRPAITSQLMKHLLDNGGLRMSPVIVAQGMGQCSQISTRIDL